jgi:23S rRNA (cytosine1962-C5)-methyltransferase
VSTSLPRVILKPRRARPFFGMHPWVFAGAIAAVEGEPADGDVVDLHSHAGNFIARGLYNGRSKLRVRLYTWSADVALDVEFFRARLQAALSLRHALLRIGGPGRACRLVFSESDGLSGLIVDQYDRWLVMQVTSLAIANRRDLIADRLMELCTPEGIYLRTERGIGALEGLELHDGLLRGAVPAEPVVIAEDGLRFLVNVAEGQKTGFYLDQRDNRSAIARLAAGRRVLDAFCYTGGFALHAASAGAIAVLGIDASESALQLARRNAELNALTQVRFEKGDVFDQFDRLVTAGERFGLVVIDPPKFARSASAVDEALRGYRRLATQSLRLLEPDGVLAMCCCTGLIARDVLHDLLGQVAAEARRPLQILESRGPSPDHPVSAACPETAYLKCVICRVG